MGIFESLGRDARRQIAEQVGPSTGAKPNKYGAVRTELDGYKFDSKKEAKRYGELKLLERAKQIESLEVHPRYSLIVAGTQVGVVEFDFRYIENGETVIEDCKGGEATNTPLFKLKRAIFEAMYGYKVRIL